MSNEPQLRSAMLTLAGAGALGLALELLLLSHWADWIQCVPFALCAVALIAVLAARFGTGRAHLRGAQLGFVLVALGSALGMVKHLQANYGFAAEIRPAATLFALMGPSLTGASPVLAPGALAGLAALGLLATWRHPLSSRP